MFYAWRSRIWGAGMEALTLRQDQANLQDQDPHEEYQANLRGTRVHSPAQGICIKLSNLG